MPVVHLEQVQLARSDLLDMLRTEDCQYGAREAVIRHRTHARAVNFIQTYALVTGLRTICLQLRLATRRSVELQHISLLQIIAL